MCEDGIAGCRSTVFVDQCDVGLQRVSLTFWPGRCGDPVELLQPRIVKFGEYAPFLDEAVEFFELDRRDRRLHVRQPVIEAEDLELR